jgi:hypothetical protein
MERLEHALLPPPIRREQQRRNVFVLFGLGGIGKTQLCAEFARRHQERFSAVLWLDGRSEETLRRSIASIVERLPKNQISQPKTSFRNTEEEIRQAVNQVLKWLSTEGNDRWLLIFDNVDRDLSLDPGDEDAYDVRNYFPGADHGSILITTRLAGLYQMGTTEELGRVDDVQALEILQNRLGCPLDGMPSSNPLQIAKPNAPHHSLG